MYHFLNLIKALVIRFLLFFNGVMSATQFEVRHLN